MDDLSHFSVGIECSEVFDMNDFVTVLWEEVSAELRGWLRVTKIIWSNIWINSIPESL